jgi:IclR family acetate operon transcriptional repressor
MPELPERAPRTGTQAIDRAIGILRQFAVQDSQLSLTVVARAAGLNTATTHRILSSLVRQRLLSYDAATERYQIGPDSVFLFAAGARRFGITASRHELDALAARIHDTATLGMLDGSDIIVVLQAESDLPLRFSRPVGTRIPVHVSAMGKAILARSDRELAGCVAQLGELHRYTPSTITEPQRLLAELELARQRGWAINDSERWDGVRAVAVAVASDDGPARAAIGVQGPASRLPDSRLDEIVAAMRASADRLALHLQLTF